MWSYANNHAKEELELLIPFPDDSLAAIEHSPTNKDHKTLGSMTCPMGTGEAAIQQMQGKAQGWLDEATNAKLSRSNF